jgi:hypothetical protein
MGAYIAVCVALKLRVQVAPADETAASTSLVSNGWIPARVRIADFPQLKELAWQVHGTGELSAREALDIYERNWRHVDTATLSPGERDLVDSLRLVFGGGSDV